MTKRVYSHLNHEEFIKLLDDFGDGHTAIHEASHRLSNLVTANKFLQEESTRLTARVEELESGIRKIVDEVSHNSGVRNEYQDFDDVYKIFEELFPTKASK